MIAGRAHFPEAVSAAAHGEVGRVARAIVCLAVAAVLVVSLRYGIYEYFHGDGRALAGVLDAIRR